MYFLLAIAAAAGLGCGLLLGGDLAGVSLTRIRIWPAFLAGAALAFSPAVPAGGFAVGALAGVLVGGTALLNIRRLVSLAVLSAGTLLNLLPLSADGGMPVSAKALAAVRGWSVARAAAAHLTGRHHIERHGDLFTHLSDNVALPAFMTVMSVGDIVIVVGLAALLAEMMLRPRPAPVSPE